MAKPKMYGMNKKYVPNKRPYTKRTNLFRRKKGKKR